jgi:hypothetical protein
LRIKVLISTLKKGPAIGGSQHSLLNEHHSLLGRSGRDPDEP